MNDQIIELRPQPLKLERYCIIVFQGYERWSFCLGMGLGKLKGSCCAVFPVGPVPQKRNPALRTPAWYGHAIITDSLLCSWETEESLYIFFKLNPLNTRFITDSFYAPSVSVLTGFDYTWKRLVSCEKYCQIAFIQWLYHYRILFTGCEVRMIFQGCKRWSFCRGMGWGKW